MLGRKSDRKFQPDGASIASSTAAGQIPSAEGGGLSQASIISHDSQKDHGELNTLPSLWDRAYDALKDSDPRLVEKYEKLLSKELQKTGAYKLQRIYCYC